jgi:hypothetical protein
MNGSGEAVADLPTRLNVGCGRDVRDGWVNLDSTWHEGMIKYRDHTWNLGDGKLFPARTDAYTEIEMSHVAEHIDNILAAVETLWLWAKPGCKLTVRCPHGASDDAWGDPTHVRPMFPQSFMYWGQGMYWRVASPYDGYRGDWSLGNVTLYTRGLDLSDIDRANMQVQHGRNFVEEMVATLYAVKPARPPVMESQDQLRVVLA